MIRKQVLVEKQLQAELWLPRSIDSRLKCEPRLLRTLGSISSEDFERVFCTSESTECNCTEDQTWHGTFAVEKIPRPFYIDSHGVSWYVSSSIGCTGGNATVTGVKCESRNTPSGSFECTRTLSIWDGYNSSSHYSQTINLPYAWCDWEFVSATNQETECPEECQNPNNQVNVSGDLNTVEFPETVGLFTFKSAKCFYRWAQSRDGFLTRYEDLNFDTNNRVLKPDFSMLESGSFEKTKEGLNQVVSEHTGYPSSYDISCVLPDQDLSGHITYHDYKFGLYFQKITARYELPQQYWNKFFSQGSQFCRLGDAFLT